MKKLLLLIILPLFFLSGCGLIENKDTACDTGYITKISQIEEQLSGILIQLSGLQAENDALKIFLSNQYTGNTLPNITTGSRYRKIYSDQYSVYTKNKTTYTICLAGNKDVCIDITQYAGNFKNYYKSLMPIEDRNNLAASRQPKIVSTISGKMQRKCSLYIESQVCFNENPNGTLVMIISDQQGVGFNGGEYDPKEILKVIDF